MKKFLAVVVCLQALYVFAQEPDNQPTNLQFAAIKPYSFQANFNTSVADGFLVIRSTSPISFVPQDGVEYQVGQGVAPGAKVFSSGSQSTIYFKEVFASTTYYITVFAFNGNGANRAYKHDNPLSGTVTSSGKLIGNYYNGISLSTPNFFQAMRNKLNFQKVWQSYSQYRNLLVPYVAERDTVNGQKVVTCQYSGEQKVYTPPFDFVAIGYSREHCLPRSWMPTGGDTQNTPEGADYHNLLLTKNANVNGLRSNIAYGEVVTVTNQYLDCKKGTNGNGVTVFEPREDVKGDAARAAFYMLVCYNGQGSFDWSFNALPSLANTQDVDVLYQWHAQDPPSPEEIARHEYVAFLQNNRNPFIDFPDLVDCIDFKTLTLIQGCNSLLSQMENSTQSLNFSVFPNPASDYLSVNMNGSEIYGITIYTVQGVEVRDVKISTKDASNEVNLPISDLTTGIYIVSLQTNHGQVSKKVIINR